ncbi:unnamed protein product [Callosobruchus maculatus]|uniref:THAP-type domain-containing protein n=1 Tax=Callosobruchus maculatus TaxID=64391 RepID=A0A653C3C7_CALMS|nr:unnamed protein product [Callosobruchus maculatus]
MDKISDFSVVCSNHFNMTMKTGVRTRLPAGAGPELTATTASSSINDPAYLTQEGDTAGTSALSTVSSGTLTASEGEPCTESSSVNDPGYPTQEGDTAGNSALSLINVSTVSSGTLTASEGEPCTESLSETATAHGSDTISVRSDTLSCGSETVPVDIEAETEAISSTTPSPAMVLSDMR